MFPFVYWDRSFSDNLPCTPFLQTQYSMSIRNHNTSLSTRRSVREKKGRLLELVDSFERSVLEVEVTGVQKV
jgi:hypothetical protein